MSRHYSILFFLAISLFTLLNVSPLFATSAEQIITFTATGEGIYYGDLAVLGDGVFPDEWSYWDTDLSVRFGVARANFILDLGQIYHIEDIAVSVDNNDDYLFEWSSDGSTWYELFLISHPTCQGEVQDGMETLSTDSEDPEYIACIDFSPPIEAAYVRISGPAGDCCLAIGEVQLFAPLPQISCVGFEPPMASGPATVRGNRALPFKASLFDVDGYPVTEADLAAPPVIQVWYDSGTGAAVDVTDEALPAGQSTEGNQFFFDSDQHWHYNLKTRSYSAPGTYTVMMDSGDASEYLIDPTCLGEFVVK